MQNKNIILNYLKEQNYDLEENIASNGLNITMTGNELAIKGTRLDLIELADLIVTIALSDDFGSHIHIDDLTLLNANSNIKSLIIEKDR